MATIPREHLRVFARLWVGGVGHHTQRTSSGVRLFFLLLYIYIYIYINIYRMSVVQDKVWNISCIVNEFLHGFFGSSYSYTFAYLCRRRVLAFICVQTWQICLRLACSLLSDRMASSQHDSLCMSSVWGVSHDEIL